MSASPMPQGFPPSKTGSSNPHTQPGGGDRQVAEVGGSSPGASSSHMSDHRHSVHTTNSAVHSSLLSLSSTQLEASKEGAQFGLGQGKSQSQALEYGATPQAPHLKRTSPSTPYNPSQVVLSHTNFERGTASPPRRVDPNHPFSRSTASLYLPLPGNSSTISLPASNLGVSSYGSTPNLNLSTSPSLGISDSRFRSTPPLPVNPATVVSSRPSIVQLLKMRRGPRLDPLDTDLATQAGSSETASPSSPFSSEHADHGATTLPGLPGLGRAGSTRPGIPPSSSMHSFREKPRPLSFLHALKKNAADTTWRRNLGQQRQGWHSTTDLPSTQTQFGIRQSGHSPSESGHDFTPSSSNRSSNLSASSSTTTARRVLFQRKKSSGEPEAGYATDTGASGEGPAARRDIPTATRVDSMFGVDDDIPEGEMHNKRVFSMHSLNLRRTSDGSLVHEGSGERLYAQNPDAASEVGSAGSHTDPNDLPPWVAEESMSSSPCSTLVGPAPELSRGDILHLAGKVLEAHTISLRTQAEALHSVNLALQNLQAEEKRTSATKRRAKPPSPLKNGHSPSNRKVKATHLEAFNRDHQSSPHQPPPASSTEDENGEYLSINTGHHHQRRAPAPNAPEWTPPTSWTPSRESESEIAMRLVHSLSQLQESQDSLVEVTGKLTMTTSTARIVEMPLAPKSAEQKTKPTEPTRSIRRLSLPAEPQFPSFSQRLIKQSSCDSFTDMIPPRLHSPYAAVDSYATQSMPSLLPYTADDLPDRLPATKVFSVRELASQSLPSLLSTMEDNLELPYTFSNAGHALTRGQPIAPEEGYRYASCESTPRGLEGVGSPLPNVPKTTLKEFLKMSDSGSRNQFSSQGHSTDTSKASDYWRDQSLSSSGGRGVLRGQRLVSPTLPTIPDCDRDSLELPRASNPRLWRTPTNTSLKSKTSWRARTMYKHPNHLSPPFINHGARGAGGLGLGMDRDSHSAVATSTGSVNSHSHSLSDHDRTHSHSHSNSRSNSNYSSHSYSTSHSITNKHINTSTHNNNNNHNTFNHRPTQSEDHPAHHHGYTQSHSNSHPTSSDLLTSLQYSRSMPTPKSPKFAAIRRKLKWSRPRSRSNSWGPAQL